MTRLPLGYLSDRGESERTVFSRNIGLLLYPNWAQIISPGVVLWFKFDSFFFLTSLTDFK